MTQEPAPQLAAGVHLDRTDTGLRIAAEPVAGARSAAIGVWIGVGSRFETPAQAGVSHLLEHMLFKGTPGRGAKEIAQAFDALGADVNAGTGRDHTVLYARVPEMHVTAAMELLGEMAARPAMTDFTQEREVVLEEIAMYEDDPEDQVHDLIGEAVFPEQPLGRPVIGTGEIVGAMTAEDLTGYHATHYVARNMVVAAAGAVDPDALHAVARSALGGLRAGARADHDRAAPGPPTIVLKRKDTEQYHLVFGAPGISRDDPRRHAQSILDSILGGSMSSRLFQEIRERRGLAYSIGSYTQGFTDGGMVGVYLGTRGANLATACEVIARELERIAAEPVSADDLDRAREQLKGRLLIGLESHGARMQRVGRAILGETDLLDIDEILARLDAVTPEAIGELAESYWLPERMSLAAIGPQPDAVREAVAGSFAHLGT